MREALGDSGCTANVIMACCKLCKSQLLLREFTESVILLLIFCKEGDTVLLAGAILGLVGHFSNA